MLSLAAAVAICAAAPLKIAAPGFSVLNLDAKEGVYYSEHFAHVLEEKGRVEVLTPGAIADLLTIERQKQLLGCAEESASCLAEITDALGAAVLLRGSIGRFK